MWQPYSWTSGEPLLVWLAVLGWDPCILIIVQEPKRQQAPGKSVRHSKNHRHNHDDVDARRCVLRLLVWGQLSPALSGWCCYRLGLMLLSAFVLRAVDQFLDTTTWYSWGSPCTLRIELTLSLSQSDYANQPLVGSIALYVVPLFRTQRDSTILDSVE